MATRDEPVTIRSGDAELAGTLVMPGIRVPGVLFVHGWGGSQTQYVGRARQVAALGCVCLAFDLSGHAQTASLRDTVSREINLRDVLAAYDRLCSHPAVDRNHIAVVGSSYGGYLASILTTMRPVKWLGLRVPALYKDQSWESPKLQLRASQDLDVWRKTFVPAAGNRALRACTQFQGDVLVVESEHDDLIPHAVISSYIESFVNAHSLTYRVIRGADHGLSKEEHQTAYNFLVTNWIGEMIRAAHEGQTPSNAPPAPAAEPLAAPETPPVVDERRRAA